MILLEARQLGVVLDGASVLEQITLQIPRGSLTVIVGPNGAGKSTLLSALVGWLPATTGSIQVAGQPLSALSPRRRARHTAWLPQHSRILDGLTVLDVVASARHRFDEPVPQRYEAAKRALETIGIGALASRIAPSLSGGEAQRVALAALVAQQADAWLLDEPANHLDPSAQGAVLALLLQAWGQGRTLITVLHDLDLISSRIEPEQAPRVSVVGLRGGRLAFQLPLDAPDLAEQLTALYGVRVARISLEGRQRLLVMP
ncbi:MAG TPA: ABC transporter ATP-binding protein [Deltaproteobacteria bacterium]|nr:ABC transporter ATP-binding protein [Deltaproteobacteria bacterium]